jgi:hypothetical protein
LPLYGEDTGDGAPLALVGAGGRLLDILGENEFDKVIIRLEPYQRDLLIWSADAKRLPGLLCTFQLKSGFEVLQFQTAEAARSALKELKEVADLCDLDQRKVAPWMPLSGRPLQQAALELRVTLDRRQLQGTAVIRFNNETEAQKLAPQNFLFDVQISPTCRKMYIGLKPFMSGDKKSLYYVLPHNWSELQITEESLLEGLKKKGLNPLGVRFAREKEFESSLDAQQEVADSISRVFTDSRTCSEGEFSIELKKAYPKDFYWCAWLRFQSSSAGLRCAKYCEVSVISTGSKKRTGYRKPVFRIRICMNPHSIGFLDPHSESGSGSKRCKISRN